MRFKSPMRFNCIASAGPKCYERGLRQCEYCEWVDQTSHSRRRDKFWVMVLILGNLALAIAGITLAIVILR